MRRPARKLLPWMIALVGCRPEPDISPYDSELLGLYTIESWTENRASCEAEGPSVLARRSERRAVVEACTYPHEGLHVAPCDDVAACEGVICDGAIFPAFPVGWDEVLRIRRDNADCDPLDPSVCADDELCVPYGHRFVCTSSVTPGQYGDPCDFESCAPGLLCVEPRWVPGCTTAGCCTRYCDASLPDAAAACEAPAEGIVCHSYYFAIREQPGREHVGVCGLGLECDGETIPADWVCDGADDCEDGADERDC